MGWLEYSAICLDKGDASEMTGVKQQSPDEKLYADAVEDESIDASEFPFDPSRIDITTQVVTVFNVIEKLRSNEIDMAPDFQRHPNLWRPWQQSRLIESLILGIPLQAFYFDVSNETVVDPVFGTTRRQVWRVVDGLQRLSAMRNFILDGKLRLERMEYLKQLEGCAFAELSPQLQSRINVSPLSLYLIRPDTPEEIKFNIFKRVNTGGLPLNQQEIRHAIFHGKGTSFISELAHLESFKNATCGRISDRRMQDREFVNRFLAFYLLDVKEAYRSMDLFLNDAIRVLNGMDSAQLDSVRERFDTAMALSSRLLGENAFKRFQPEDNTWSLKINKAVFETLSVALARLSMDEQERLASCRDFELHYMAMFSSRRDDETFNDLVTVSTGNRRKVLERHELMARFMNHILGEP